MAKEVINMQRNVEREMGCGALWGEPRNADRRVEVAEVVQKTDLELRLAEMRQNHVAEDLIGAGLQAMEEGVAVDLSQQRPRVPSNWKH